MEQKPNFTHQTQTGRNDEIENYLTNDSWSFVKYPEFYINGFPMKNTLSEKD